MKKTVKVWNDEVEVSINQTSKSVWVASGTYMGRLIQVKDRNANSAVALWQDAARYRGG